MDRVAAAQLPPACCPLTGFWCFASGSFSSTSLHTSLFACSLFFLMPGRVLGCGSVRLLDGAVPVLRRVLRVGVPAHELPERLQQPRPVHDHRLAGAARRQRLRREVRLLQGARHAARAPLAEGVMPPVRGGAAPWEVCRLAQLWYHGLRCRGSRGLGRWRCRANRACGKGAGRLGGGRRRRRRWRRRAALLVHAPGRPRVHPRLTRTVPPVPSGAGMPDVPSGQQSRRLCHLSFLTPVPICTGFYPLISRCPSSHPGRAWAVTAWGRTTGTGTATT